MSANELRAHLARDDPDDVTRCVGALYGGVTQSKNAMALVDARRRLVDANGAFIELLGYERRAIIGRPMYPVIVGGPLVSPPEWRVALAAGRFTGEAGLVCASGDSVGVQWAATAEVVTGRQLILFVALSIPRCDARFRRTVPQREGSGALSPREREIVGLVALGNTSLRSRSYFT